VVLELIEPEDMLEVSEQHLDAFALAARLIEGRRVVGHPGDVAGILAKGYGRV